MGDLYTEPKDLCRMKMINALGYDDNANARPETSGSSTQRPNSAPASVCGHSVCRHGSCQFSPFRNASATQADTNRSSVSLAASRSFETPYGVVRQSSSSTVEPVRMHSGTSQESFRREMSVYKLHAMPVLAEDANSSDEEDELGQRVKRSDPSKLKKTKGEKWRMGKQKRTEERERKARNRTPTNCSNIFKLFCSCGKSTDGNSFDSGKLLDVTKDANELEHNDREN